MFAGTLRWLTAAALVGAHLAAAAQPSAERARTEQVAVRLISNAATVAPGQTVYLGLEQKIIEAGTPTGKIPATPAPAPVLNGSFRRE